MNWDMIEGKWKEIRGQVRSRWGKLTDSDMEMLAGKKDQLVGKIQERYGIVRDEAERQVDDWMRRLDEPRGQKGQPPRERSRH